MVQFKGSGEWENYAAAIWLAMGGNGLPQQYTKEVAKNPDESQEWQFFINLLLGM